MKLSNVAIATLIALAGATPADAKKPIELHFGNERWHLVLPAVDLKPIDVSASTPDRQVFTYHSGQMILSVIVENAREPATMASLQGCL